MSIVRKLILLYRRQGLMAVLARVNHSLARRWTLRGDFTCKKLSKNRTCPQSSTVHWATSRDLESLKAFLAEELIWHIEIDECRARSDWIALAFSGDEIIGFEIYRQKELRFPPFPWFVGTLQPNEAWALYSYVTPAHRGRGVVQDLIAFAEADLYKQGIRYVFGLTDLGNTAARHAHTRRGFAIVGAWSAFQIFGFKWFSLNGIRRFGMWTRRRPLSVRLGDLATRGLCARRDQYIQPPESAGREQVQ